MIRVQEVFGDEPPPTISPPLATIDPCDQVRRQECLTGSYLVCFDADFDGLSDRDEFVVAKTDPLDYDSTVRSVLELNPILAGL